MTRLIAIPTLTLTLTLMTVHSVQAFPHYTDWHGVKSRPDRSGSHFAGSHKFTRAKPIVSGTVTNLGGQEGEPLTDYPGIRNSSDSSNFGSRSDVGSNGLIAIIAIESGPDVAYGMLRSMGFSPAEADGMIIEAVIDHVHQGALSTSAFYIVNETE